MSIEKQPRNDTEAQQFLSIYPIPDPIRLPHVKGKGDNVLCLTKLL